MKQIPGVESAFEWKAPTLNNPQITKSPSLGLADQSFPVPKATKGKAHSLLQSTKMKFSETGAPSHEISLATLQTDSDRHTEAQTFHNLDSTPVLQWMTKANSLFVLVLDVKLPGLQIFKGYRDGGPHSSCHYKHSKTL